MVCPPNTPPNQPPASVRRAAQTRSLLARLTGSPYQLVEDAYHSSCGARHVARGGIAWRRYLPVGGLVLVWSDARRYWTSSVVADCRGVPVFPLSSRGAAHSQYR